jgi:hypothetical protein
MKRETKKQIFAVFVLLMFLGSGAAFAVLSALPSSNQNVHWHSLLNIIIEGQLITIPANVGTTGEDVHPASIHTHENDNVIHKEGPATLTLGSFFTTWDKIFNSTCVFDKCNNGNKTVKMFIQQCPSDSFTSCSAKQSNFEFEKYVVKDKEIITLEYD